MRRLPTIALLVSVAIAALVVPERAAAQQPLTVYPPVPLRIAAAAGDSAVAMVMLSNEGGSRVRIFSLEFSGPDRARFSLGGDVTTAVTVGKYAALPIMFRPVDSGSCVTTLRIVLASAVVDTMTIPIEGVGFPMGATLPTLSPDAILAPMQLVGDAWESLCTLRNPSRDTLRVAGAAFFGPHAARFSFADPPPALLAPGAAHTLRLRCMHAVEETLFALLRVEWNERLPVCALVEVPWRLRRPRLDLTDVLVDFGGVMVGEDTFAGVRIRNRGTTALRVRNFVLDGPAASDYRHRLPDSLELGADQSIFADFIFAPSALGERSASLRFDCNDPDTPQAAITLRGYGMEYRRPHIATDESQIAFGQVYVGYERSDTLTLYNTGLADLYIHNVENRKDASYPDTEPCELHFNPFEPLIVRVQDSLKVTVTFRPTASYGWGGRSRVVFYSNDPKRPEHSIIVTGHSRMPPTISTDPEYLLFPSVPPGDSLDLPLRILSAQNFLSDVILSSHGIIGDDAAHFRIVSDLPQDARINISKEITVRYYQDEAGSRIAFLRLRSNDPARPVLDVPLLGFDYGLDIPDERPVAGAADLRCWPNPFTTSTTIACSFPPRRHATLDVVDALGRVHASWILDAAAAGTRYLQFDGSALPPGLFVIRLHAGVHSASLRLLKMR